MLVAVNVPAVAVIVYCVPTSPENVQLAALTYPSTGTKLVQVDSDTVGDVGATVKLTGVVVAVTTWLPASSNTKVG